MMEVCTDMHRALDRQQASSQTWDLCSCRGSSWWNLLVGHHRRRLCTVSATRKLVCHLDWERWDLGKELLKYMYSKFIMNNFKHTQGYYSEPHCVHQLDDQNNHHSVKWRACWGSAGQTQEEFGISPGSMLLTCSAVFMGVTLLLKLAPVQSMTPSLVGFQRCVS